MAYSYWELALYFSLSLFFGGWLVEVGSMPLRKSERNRGILTLPLSFSYGISMVLLILLPTLESITFSAVDGADCIFGGTNLANF